MSRHARHGVFLNLEGILADSAGALRAAFERFAASCGATASDGLFAEISGPPLPMVVTALKRRWAVPLGLDGLVRRYSALIDEAFLSIAPASGAAATLDAAFRNGWAIGVVTSGTGARTRAWLARTRLARFVDIVIGGNEVCLGKPDPEPYRIALARSGCARELSIAIEDSPPGARSALAAGIRSYGIAAPNAAELQWPDGLHLIGALDELIPEFERRRMRRAGERRR